MSRDRPLAAGIMLRCRGLILLTLRDTGTWSTPGGFLNRGETAEQAAWRELDEELEFRHPWELTRDVALTHVNEAWRYTTLVVPVARPLRVRVRTWELTAARWLPIADGPPVPCHPGLRESWHDVTRDRTIRPPMYK